MQSVYRSRLSLRIHATIIVLVILSMVVGPALQVQAVYAAPSAAASATVLAQPNLMTAEEIDAAFMRTLNTYLNLPADMAPVARQQAEASLSATLESLSAQRQTLDAIQQLGDPASFPAQAGKSASVAPGENLAAPELAAPEAVVQPDGSHQVSVQAYNEQTGQAIEWHLSTQPGTNAPGFDETFAALLQDSVAQASLRPLSAPVTEPLAQPNEDRTAVAPVPVNAEFSSIVPQTADPLADARVAQTVAPAPAAAVAALQPQAPSFRQWNVCQQVGSCDYTTIQGAIDAASDGDSINISSGTYSAETYGITINKSLTIRGNTTQATIVDAEGYGRVFWIGSGVIVTLENLIIQNGNVLGPAGVPGLGKNGALAYGGGIYNAGSLTLRNSAVISNTVIGGDGDNDYGGNGGAAEGGGIYNDGYLTLDNVTLSGNTATGGKGGNGLTATATTTVTLGWAAVPQGNRGNGRGGGIFNTDSRGFGEIHIVRSTITDNAAKNGSSGVITDGVGGGGIYSVFSAQKITLAGTILAGNTADEPEANDCSAVFRSDGYNIIPVFGGFGNRYCLTAYGFDNFNFVKDKLNSGFVLEPLEDNGGATLTHAFTITHPTSPAFDAIPIGSALCTGTDQRGIARPKNNGCDIGAYEFADVDIGIAYTGPKALTGGQRITLTFPINNDGDMSATNVQVTVRLVGTPLTFVSGVGTTCNASARNVLCSFPSIVAKGIVTASFTVDVDTIPNPEPSGYPLKSEVKSDEIDKISLERLPNTDNTTLKVTYWDTSIGAPGPGADVNALAVDSAIVYAGAGDGVKTWNGSVWSPLGSVGGAVHALALVNPTLIYAGGDFGVKSWDGAGWTALGGLTGTVYALAVDSDGRLHAGGDFVGGYARWDAAQTKWISPPGGPTGPVYALAVLAPDVFVGGAFTSPGKNIAKWSQTEAKWSALNDPDNLNIGLNAQVNALAVIGSALIAGGAFDSPTGGGLGPVGLARWDGVRWSDVGVGVTPGKVVKTLLANGSDLYVGGDFVSVGKAALPANGVARWNGANWSALDGGLTNGSPNALALDSATGHLVAGGSFGLADGSLVPSAKVAQWRRPTSDLALTLTSSASQVSPGADITFTVTIVNNGLSPATGVVVRNTLPVSFTFNSAQSAAECSEPTPGSGGVECSPPGAQLAAGAPAMTFTMVAAAPAALGNYVVRASVGAAQPELAGFNNYAEAPVQVELRTDLSLTLSGPATIMAGEPMTYTLMAANAGSEDAPATRVTANLPGGVAFVPAASTPSCALTSLPGVNQEVVCDLGVLSSTVSVPLLLVVDVDPTVLPDGKIVDFTAALTSQAADSTPATPTAVALSTTVYVGVDLEATLSAPSKVYTGTKIVYQVMVTNYGPSQAQGVQVSQSLPANGVFKTVTRPDYEIPGCSYDQVNHKISCQIDTLAPGETARFTVKVGANGLAHGTLLASSLSVSTVSPEEITGNNSAAAQTTLSTDPADNVAGLSLVESAPSTTPAGGVLTYTLVAKNSGPTTATGGTLVSTLPVSYTTFNPGASTAGCSVSAGKVTCVLADLDANDQQTVKIAVDVAVTTPPGTTLAAATTFEADQGLPTTASASSNVVIETDLGVSVAAPATRNTGQDLVYVLTVVNHGPSNATGVALVNTLPDGVIYGGVTGPAAATCTPDGVVITCLFGALAAGASQVVSVTVTAFNVGVLVDSAKVSGFTADPKRANNTATAGTSVGQGTPEEITIGAGKAKITITANAFIDQGGGETKALGDVYMGDNYRLAGPGDYLIIKSSTEAEGFGAVTLVGIPPATELALFTGHFTVGPNTPDPTATPPVDPATFLTPAKTVFYNLNTVFGFKIHSDLAITQVDLSGGATTVTATLQINPPGISEFVGADFEIEAGPTISGTVGDFSFMIAGSIYAITEAALNNEGILVPEVALTGPAQYGGKTSLLINLLITKDGLSFDGKGASFPLGPIYLVGDPPEPKAGETAVITNSVVLTEGVATLSYVAGTYVVKATGVLSITLPGNEQSPTAKVTFDSGGNVSGNLSSLDLKVAGGVLAMKDISINNDGLTVAVASYTLPVTMTQKADDGKKTGTARETTITVEEISITDDGLSIGGAGLTFPLPDIRIGDGKKLKFTKLAATLGVSGLNTTPNYYLGIAGVMNLRVPQNDQDVVFTATVDYQGNFSGGLDQLSLTISKASLQLEEIGFDNTGLTAMTGTLSISVTKLSGTDPIKALVTEIRVDEDGLTVGGGGAVIPLPDFKLGSAKGISVTAASLSFFIKADRTYEFTIAATILVKIDKVESSVKGRINLDHRGKVTGKLESFSLTVAGVGIFVEDADITGEGVNIAKAGLSVPESWGGLAVEVYSLKITDDGFTIGGGRFQLPDIKVGSVTLAGLYGSFEQKPGGYEISAGGKFLIPGLGGGGTCGILVGVTLFAESSTSTVMQLRSVQAPAGIDDLSLKNVRAGLEGCKIPIGQTGFYLTRVEGLLTLNSGATRVDLGMSIEGGPEFAGYSAVRGDGHMGVVFDPFQIDLDGAVTVFAIFKAAEMKASVRQGFFSGTLLVNGFIGPMPTTGVASLTVWTTDGTFHMVGRATLTFGLVKGSWGNMLFVPLPPFDLQLAQIGTEFGEFVKDKNTTTWGLKGWTDIVGVRVGFYFDRDGTVAIGNIDKYNTVTPPGMAQARAVWDRLQAGSVTRTALSAQDQAALAGLAFVAAAAFVDLPVPVRTDLIVSLKYTGTPPIMTLVRPDGAQITPAALPSNVVYMELPGDGVNFFTVNQARPGTWQVKLSRDLVAGEELQIGGIAPAPVLTDLAVANSDLTHVNAAWQLSSAQISTTLNLYATTGPITVTQTITDANGLRKDIVVDNFGGFPVALNVPTTLDGLPNTANLDLSGLETGTYYLWFEADDLRNPPVRTFVPNPIQVVQSWQDSWFSNVRATTGYRDVSVAWDASPNPDVDGYELRIGTLPGVVERVVEAGDFVSVTVTGLTPNQIYYMTPVARDDDTGRKSVAGDTVTVTAASAAFQVIPDTSDFTLIAGQSVLVNLTVSSSLATYPEVMVGVSRVYTENGSLVVFPGDEEYTGAGVLYAVIPVTEILTPTVALAEGEMPDGIHLDLITDLVEATGTVVPMTIDTSASLPGGVYAATLVGRSEGVEISVPLQITILEPDFSLTASSDLLTFDQGGSASLNLTADPVNGSVRPVRLSVGNVPVGMIPSLTTVTIAPDGVETAVLTLRGTSLLPSGEHVLTVIGEDGLHTHSVDITVAKPGFGLATADKRKLATAGDSAVYAIDVSAFQWGSPIHLELDQFSFVPGSILGFATTEAGPLSPSLDVTGPTTVYLIVDVGATTRQILYALTVLGSSGEKTDALPLELQVTDPASLDLGITQPSALSATAGTIYSYTLTVHNYGPGDGNDVVVVNSLPTAYASLVSAVSAGGSCSAGAGVITCGLGTLTRDADATVVVTLLVAADAPAGTDLINVADVNSSNPNIDLSNNRTIGTAKVNRSADVAVTQSVSGPAVAGLGLSYTLTVHNAGPSQASTGVVRDLLPAGMTFVSADPACAYIAIAHAVTCRFDTLAPGADVAYAITGTVKPDARGALVNTVQVLAQETDPVPANNFPDDLTTPVTPQVTLVVDKQVSTSAPDEGAVFDYTIIVRNDGPSTATGVTVSDVLPAGLALAGSITRLPVGNGLVGAPPLLLYGASLAVGASLTLTLPVNVVDGFGQTIVNRVEAISAENLAPVGAEIEITGVNVDPTGQVLGGPYRVNEGSQIVLVGVGIDAAGQHDPLLYEWDLNYDGAFDVNAVGQAVTFDAFDLDGPSIRPIALRVTDGDGGIIVVPSTISILNVAPKVNAGVDQMIYEGDRVTLEPSVFTDAGRPDTHTATIDWGDGQQEPASGITLAQTSGAGTIAASHQYLAGPGAYVVTVTVTDDDGASTVDTMNVTVLNGFLRFCAYGDSNPGVSLGQDASASCGQVAAGVPGELRPSGLGARGHVDLQDRSVVVGNLTSLDDKVDVSKDAQVQGTITAGGEVKIGDRALVEQDIASGDKVEVKGEAVVLGDITATGEIKVDRDASVGSVTPNAAPPTILAISLVNFTVAPGIQDVTVDKGAVLALGSTTPLGAVKVKEGGTLILSAGRYTFRKLDVDKDAVVEFDLSAGPIVVDVAESVDMAERVQMIITSTIGDARSIFFRVGKNVNLKRDGVFLGTYLAPYGHIELGENAVLTGAMYAEKIDVKKQARLIGLPARNLFAYLFVDPNTSVLPAPNQPDFALTITTDSTGRVRPGTQVGFTVHITNTGDVPITFLPLRVVYSKKYLDFNNAGRPADLITDKAGILDWLDLTNPGGPLGTGQTLTRDLSFTARKDTGTQIDLSTLVLAVVNGARASLTVLRAADDGGVVPSVVLPTKSDSANVSILSPTATSVLNMGAAATQDGVRLTWETGSEVNTAGFHLVRVGQNGREQTVTDAPIPAQMAGQANGAVYTYMDMVDSVTAADAAYFVEVLQIDGEIQRVALGRVVTVYSIYLPVMQR